MLFFSCSRQEASRPPLSARLTSLSSSTTTITKLVRPVAVRASGLGLYEHTSVLNVGVLVPGVTDAFTRERLQE